MPPLIICRPVSTSGSMEGFYLIFTFRNNMSSAHCTLVYSINSYFGNGPHNIGILLIYRTSYWHQQDNTEVGFMFVFL